MRKFKTTTLAATLISGLLSLEHAAADIKLPAIISDHMVMQRGTAVPVWGWADPGEAVAVSIAGQSVATKADAAGTWRIKLENLSATEPVSMTVKGNNTLTVNDILIGEVWLASGQSNMQMPVNGVNNARQEVNNAKFPQIRMFTVERKTAVTPQNDCGGKWIVCSPQTAMHFSATAYFFGRELHQTQKVPIGLINASWGGTPIEAWTSMDAQKKKPELAPIFKTWEAKVAAPFNETQAIARYDKQMEAWKNHAEKAKAAGKRPPPAPKRPIAPRLQPRHPANLFNGMIAPLIPYAIRGGIWYQGEGNSAGPSAPLYETQLRLLLGDWRQRWNQGDFPFAWVQLPNFKKRVDDPNAPATWPIVREGMLKALSTPNTGMAITIDAGDAADIHPKDKQTVGKRLSLWARAQVYGEKIPFSGPLISGHQVKGDDIVISFTHADGGLVAKGGELKGFAVAGADRKWGWAKARIVGDQVIVSSPDGKAPMAVRYAWADNPECNLTNGAGLPASPFRTATW